MLLTTILVIVLAFYIKEWYMHKKYGLTPNEKGVIEVPADELTGETEFDKKFNKLLSSFNRKKKKKDEIAPVSEEQVEELLENLKASGKAHLGEDKDNEFLIRLDKRKIKR